MTLRHHADAFGALAAPKEVEGVTRLGDLQEDHHQHEAQHDVHSAAPEYQIAHQHRKRAESTAADPPLVARNENNTHPSILSMHLVFFSLAGWPRPAGE